MSTLEDNFGEIPDGSPDAIIVAAKKIEDGKYDSVNLRQFVLTILSKDTQMTQGDAQEFICTAIFELTGRTYFRNEDLKNDMLAIGLLRALLDQNKITQTVSRNVAMWLNACPKSRPT